MMPAASGGTVSVKLTNGGELGNGDQTTTRVKDIWYAEGGWFGCLVVDDEEGFGICRCSPPCCWRLV